MISMNNQREKIRNNGNCFEVIDRNAEEVNELEWMLDGHSPPWIIN